ncbi:MAG: hypothetical protein K0Q57_1072 [Gammaproteobacteria bacterium]|jgi:hypothetical protein|nr:hypothetical protein [Gammaproteobacteria bacterium]
MYSKNLGRAVKTIASAAATSGAKVLIEKSINARAEKDILPKTEPNFKYGSAAVTFTVAFQVTLGQPTSVCPQRGPSDKGDVSLLR